MGVSVLILTLNEEQNILPCIDSVRWCDDIVVLDSFSTDRTVEMAKAAGVRLFQRRFDDFASQRNYALDEIPFKHRWVFHLDADERFTEPLQHECEAATTDDRSSGFLVPSKLMFMDKWLRWSGMYPVYQMRLMKLGEIRFIQRGHGQREADAKRGVGTLHEPYLHYNFSKGLDDWREKHDRYSTKEAEESLHERLTGQISWSDLLAGDPVKRRRALKQISMRLPGRPALRFLYMYALRLGVLDGGAGLAYCRLIASYEAMIVRKMRALETRGTLRESPQ
jgi:glycosyltransferase involved in cell wall biosynthesis